MSINLTRLLQQITGLNSFFQGPAASRQAGVVLLDTATVTWATDGQGNVQATSTGAMSLIQAQTPSTSVSTVTFALPAGYRFYKLMINASSAGNTATYFHLNFNGDSTGANYYANVIGGSYSGTGVTQTVASFSAGFVPVTSNNADVTLYPASGGGMGVSSVGNGQGTVCMAIAGGLWTAATLATSMTVATDNASNFAAGGVIALYGIT
jgi:hypothetical protein